MSDHNDDIHPERGLAMWRCPSCNADRGYEDDGPGCLVCGEPYHAMIDEFHCVRRFRTWRSKENAEAIVRCDDCDREIYKFALPGGNSTPEIGDIRDYDCPACNCKARMIVFDVGALAARIRADT